MDLIINETLQTGAVRIPHLPFYRLVGTVSNCAYAVRLETAPTEGRKCLFIFRIHYNCSLLRFTSEKLWFFLKVVTAHGVPILSGSARVTGAVELAGYGC